jgi:hypothetical protein
MKPLCVRGGKANDITNELLILPKETKFENVMLLVGVRTKPYLWWIEPLRMTGSDISHMTGSDVSHCPEVCSAHAQPEVVPYPP